jgi:hypothetical protein
MASAISAAVYQGRAGVLCLGDRHGQRAKESAA